MSPLMSRTVTLVCGPPASSTRKATSPVPPATSRWRKGRFLGGRSVDTRMLFHARWRPADIRSFMRSYRRATERKTSFTRACFSMSGTVSKPKSVVPSLSRVMVALNGRRAAACIAEAWQNRYVRVMPELPEVETVRRGLEPAMVGSRIVAVEQRRPDLRFPFPARFAARLTGQEITSLRRRAKYLLADLSSGEVLVMHLGMTGRF